MDTTRTTQAPPAATASGNSHVEEAPLSPDELRMLDAYWRASNYLSVGQIYLLDNPLLKEPLKREHIKPRLLGHWGTSPGLNMLCVHLNRVIKKDDLDVIYIIGPGHGGPSLVAHAYLEGTYSEIYPEVGQDEEGMRRLFKQFSFPGGIPSHVAPETPGSIHEGGELGYALSHAYGAVFDNPDLIVACVVGDGEAETGPLATGWHGNKFLNPARDGCVLPILHLNGYKIANPCFLARIPKDELQKFFEGMGYRPYFVEGHDPEAVHQQLAGVLDAVVAEIRRIQDDARRDGVVRRPAWPMIIFRTPKGWTCPPEIDGKKCEGYWRSHQVPMGDMDKPEHIRILEEWMKSYRPEELFDARGRLIPELAELAPKGHRRMSDNPHANGGLLLRDLRLPDFRDYAVDVPSPGATTAESARMMGTFLRDVMKLNLESRNFRLFSPDENNSNRWQDVLEVTDRCYMAEIYPEDDHLSPDGRVMEVLSEHQCQGWLEGYLLTGRHGFFSCYEAFIHIIDSMFNQHAKWLKVCNHIPWRRPIASFNYFLSSHVWRQDHNGLSHQDPGFLDHVVNKKAEVIRVYLPPDANCLLSVTDHCLRSRNYVNVVVAGKQPAPQWLTMDQAVKHCTLGLGIWEWASNDKGGEPDVVMACCGDVPTLETLAAVELLRRHLPELKVRVVNVVNLMKLQPSSEHPHGLPDHDFDALFTKDKPIIFAFHGYPWLIHRLTYRRTNHKNLHVRGYKEEGTTTTPFDMVVLNDLDRFHLCEDVIDRLPQLGARAAYFKQAIHEKLIEHKQYIDRYGDDMPAISGWTWGENVQVGPAPPPPKGTTSRGGSPPAGRRRTLDRRPPPGGSMPSELPRLFLARHGDTAWTDTRRHTGRTDVPLNERGEERARQFGERLRRFSFACVFTSPLQRAAKTCELAGFGEVATVDPELVEWDYGRFEGMLTKDIVEERPGWELFRDGCPEGESSGDVAARADAFIARVRRIEGDVLAFSSGHIIRMIAARWLGLPPGNGRFFYCRPASVGVLGFEHRNRDEPILWLWNQVAQPRE